MSHSDSVVHSVCYFSISLRAFSSGTSLCSEGNRKRSWLVLWACSLVHFRQSGSKCWNTDWLLCRAPILDKSYSSGLRKRARADAERPGLLHQFSDVLSLFFEQPESEFSKLAVTCAQTLLLLLRRQPALIFSALFMVSQGIFIQLVMFLTK